jgi:protein phosphatase
MANRIALEVSASTHVGAKRSENEDRVLVANLDASTAHVGAFAGRLEVGSGGALLAVCDGMGGEAGGEIASTTAVATLYREAAASLPGRSAQGVARGVLDAVQTASRDIELLAHANMELSRMGTTATVCAIAEGRLIVAQVGDSRAYLLRGGRLLQLTRDQTLATLLIERGQLTPDQLDTFELNHVILQALGHAGGVDVDLGWALLATGDVLLICSDGLHGCVEHATLTAALGADVHPSEICSELVRLALAAGAPDNVSCVVARVAGGLEARDSWPRLEKVVLPVAPASAEEPVASAPADAEESTLSRLRALLGFTR